jgi:uncharacterized protein YndB with AHSA1/START domain
MLEASNSVTIAKPPEEVFAFLADGTNNTRWRSGTLDISHRSGEGKGAVYEQGVKGPFGKRVPADYEITEFEPASRLAFRAITGPVRPEGSFDLEPVARGTSVAFSLRCSPKGFAKLMTPMVAKTMRSEVAQLERLAAVLDDQPGGRDDGVGR